MPFGEPDDTNQTGESRWRTPAGGPDIGGMRVPAEHTAKLEAAGLVPGAALEPRSTVPDIAQMAAAQYVNQLQSVPTDDGPTLCLPSEPAGMVEALQHLQTLGVPLPDDIVPGANLLLTRNMQSGLRDKGVTNPEIIGGAEGRGLR
jgi:hypothetical protein